MLRPVVARSARLSRAAGNEQVVAPDYDLRQFWDLRNLWLTNQVTVVIVEKCTDHTLQSSVQGTIGKGSFVAQPIR